MVPGSSSQLYGTSNVTDMATDASGNILVTGFFTGTTTFGSTRLVSAGNEWAWLQRGGGRGRDMAYGPGRERRQHLPGRQQRQQQCQRLPGIVRARQRAVRHRAGPSTGTFVSGSDDMVLIKFVDNGTSASVAWSQVAGGHAGRGEPRRGRER